MHFLRFALGGVTVFSLFSLAASPAHASFLYAVGNGGTDGSSSLYRIEHHATAPVAVPIAEVGLELFDLAVDPTTDRFYAVARNQNLYELDPSTAAPTLIGRLGRTTQNALEFDAAGQLYSWGFGDRNLYAVDKNSGFVTRLGDTGFLSAGDLAFHPNGFLYGTTTANQLVKINPLTGSAVLVGSLGFSGPFGLEVDAEGNMYVGQSSEVTFLARLYSVDEDTAAATLIANITGAAPLGLNGLAFAAPQPSGLSILSACVTTISILSRHRPRAAV